MKCILSVHSSSYEQVGVHILQKEVTMKCDLCTKTFKTPQGVAVHKALMHKHTEETNGNAHPSLLDALAAQQSNKTPLTAGEVLGALWMRMSEEDKLRAIEHVFET